MKTCYQPAKVPVGRPFNMIEIVLALVIVVIGVIGIMGLFPAGQQASAEARGRNYAFDASDSFLRYFASQAKENWSLVGSLPASKPGADAEDAGLNWQTQDSNNIFGNIPGTVLQYNDLDNDGKFDFRINANTGDLERDGSGLFHMQHLTANNQADFDGVLRVWTTTATYKSYTAASNEWSALKPVPSTAGITVNVEASWPSEVPYAQRQKKTAMLDLYSPAEETVEELRGAFRIAQDGRLRITFRASDAGLVSGLFMSEPEQREIFASNKPQPQVSVVDVPYTAGTEFNFFSRTYGSSWGIGTYDHYAWASLDDPSIPYYDWSQPSPKNKNGAYDYLTGNPYCIVTEIVPGTQWHLAFEDLPCDWDHNGRADGIDWDYNDIEIDVELITDSPAPDVTVGIGGTININPSNSNNNEFSLTKPDGSQITRDMLHSGFTSGYTGGAISVVVRPKGNGNQNGLTVNGAGYDLENKNRYEITAESMTVKLYNDKISKGKAMGRWWIDIDATNATIVVTK